MVEVTLDSTASFRPRSRNSEGYLGVLGTHKRLEFIICQDNLVGGVRVGACAGCR